MNTIEIPLSKTKLILLLIGAIAFVVIGFSFAISPETFQSNLFNNSIFIRLAGIAAVLFFGGVSIYTTKKVVDTLIGLTIDENGIYDNTTASSVGLIKWADITTIKTEQVMSTKFLLLFVTDPNKYLDRANGLKRRLMEGNMKMFGTPLSITSSTLKCDFDKLEELVKESLTQKSFIKE